MNVFIWIHLFNRESHIEHGNRTMLEDVLDRGLDFACLH